MSRESHETARRPLPPAEPPRGEPAPPGGEAGALLPLVETLVRVKVVSRIQVAEARAGADEASRADPLWALTARHRAQAAVILRAVCQEERVMDYVDIEGFPIQPRLLARVPEPMSRATGAVPTVLLTRGAPTALLLASDPVAPETRAALAKALRATPAFLRVEPETLEGVRRQGYATIERRGQHNARLGEILLRQGRIAADVLEQDRKEARASGRRLGEILLQNKRIGEHDLYATIAAQRGLALTDADTISAILDRALCTRLPAKYLRHNQILPYRRRGDAVLAATTDPAADTTLLASALQTREIVLEVITPGDLARLLDSLEQPVASAAPAEQEERLLDVGTAEEADVTTSVEDSERYTRVVDRILITAIRMRASDIHLEIYDQEVFVRFRIDGQLQDIEGFPMDPATLRGVVNVIKIRSGIDISERRLPQGGRMNNRTSTGDVYDFRVQTQKALHGEHVVIRILSQSQQIMPLENLGFSAGQSAFLHRIMRNPSGLVLITGPTGSGKTSTLYSMLDILRRSPDIKILTIEDPIEYSLDRVQQSQILPDIGYSFADALRAFLREDPDVILVGEIRDRETAVEAVRASQTGHLVFSTLHTNDAVDAIHRLLGLDLDASSIGSELVVVLAQRLARRVCDACREPYDPDPEAIRELFPHGPPVGTVFTRGAGCGLCRGAGYRGRVAIVEMWPVSEGVRDSIIRGASAPELRRIAHEQGVVSMVRDAIDKVLSGTTTPEEILNVIPYNKIEIDRAYSLQGAGRGPAAPPAPPPRARTRRTPPPAPPPAQP